MNNKKINLLLCPPNAKYSNGHFAREDILETHEMKLNLLVIWEMQIENHNDVLYTLFKIAKNLKIGHTSCWQECGGTGTPVPCWLECKMVQPLGKIIWHYHEKLNIYLKYEKERNKEMNLVHVTHGQIFLKSMLSGKKIYILYHTMCCIKF